jgi:hypothetical protein
MKTIYLVFGILFGLAIHSAFATQMHETDGFWVSLSIPDTYNGQKVSSATAFAGVLMDSEKSCDISSEQSTHLENTRSVRMNQSGDHLLSAKTQLVVYSGECGAAAIQPVVRYSLILEDGKHVQTEMTPITTKMVLDTHSDEEYERIKMKLDRQLQASKSTTSQAQEMSLVIAD